MPCRAATDPLKFLLPSPPLRVESATPLVSSYPPTDQTVAYDLQGITNTGALGYSDTGYSDTVYLYSDTFFTPNLSQINILY